MTTLDIDIETYSSASLSDCGVYRYVEAPDFCILLFSWSEDGGPVQCADLALGEAIPPRIVEALYDPAVVKYAHNAAFEMCCLSHHFRRPVDVRQWDCTMILCARLGFPLALGQAAKVLHLDEQKMTEGKALIRYFCQPATAGKNKGNRNAPELHADKWQTFKAYCLQDVATEQAIRLRLQGIIDVPAWERRLYEVDYAINRRGVAVDVTLARRAVAMAAEVDAKLMAEARELTGLGNPLSVVQAKEWIRQKQMLRTAPASLDKDAMKVLLASPTLHPDVRRYIGLRQQLAKTSVKKYEAMLNAVCADGRIHGLLQYYGTFTGRWAGRLVQLQNLPQNHLRDIAAARAMLLDGDALALEATYGDVKQVLSELIRTAFIPAPAGCGSVSQRPSSSPITDHCVLFPAPVGCGAVSQRPSSSPITDRYVLFPAPITVPAASPAGSPQPSTTTSSPIFHVCDFSAIEARVLSWLACEDWVVEVFRTHGKIYEATAAQMYHVPVADIHKGDPRRQRGKIATLALGYGGGVGALEAMDPTGIIPEAEKRSTVKMWRDANPHIVRFWRILEEAAIRAINTGREQQINKGILLNYHRGCLIITLPSGRSIVYPRVRLEEEETAFGAKTTISYERLDQTTRQWGRARTYGGKLTENVVQSTARDILAVVLLREYDAGLNVVFHVHDETITEATTDVPLATIEALFSAPIPWARGLPLKGAGYSGPFYFKD